MKRTHLSLAACLLLVGLAVIGCAQLTQTVSAVCADLAKVTASPAAALLNAQDPHSSVGVLWAEVSSACANGTPVSGVDASWTGQVWGELKAILPQVLPAVLPLLAGLL